MSHHFTPKQMHNCLKFIIFVSIAVTFALAFYTFHDLQTAEGAGLYLSITFSHSTRTLFDIIVDLAGILLFFLAIYLPTKLLKYKSMESFFRLFSIYLAFMPIVHPGKMVHLINDFQNLRIYSHLSQGAFLDYIFQDLQPLFSILKIFVPFLLLVYVATKLIQIQTIHLPKWFFILLFLFLLSFCLFENIADFSLYFLYYMLILWCYQKLEAISSSVSRFAVWNNIIIFGCLLRGIYRMLSLMSTTHM